jgi:hypothetical protein
VAQGEGPEFKPQYHKKINKLINHLEYQGRYAEVICKCHAFYYGALF